MIIMMTVVMMKVMLLFKRVHFIFCVFFDVVGCGFENQTASFRFWLFSGRKRKTKLGEKEKKASSGYVRFNPSRLWVTYFGR